MGEVTETTLPGVGVRHEFTTDAGKRVGVISHHGGRREVLVYDLEDPDACTTALHLSAEDTRTMAELLGASQVSATLGAVRQELAGLAIDWVTLSSSSPLAGHAIADGEIRTRTGASIVAVIREGSTHAAPGPGFVLEADDVIVAVGTTDGLEELRSVLGT